MVRSPIYQLNRISTEPYIDLFITTLTSTPIYAYHLLPVYRLIYYVQPYTNLLIIYAHLNIP